jgi:hypothetical protein
MTYSLFNWKSITLVLSVFVTRLFVENQDSSQITLIFFFESSFVLVNYQYIGIISKKPLLHLMYDRVNHLYIIKTRAGPK